MLGEESPAHGSEPAVSHGPETAREPDLTERMKRAQYGDEKAFAIIVEELQGRVFNYILKRQPNRADAEDWTQEVFLAAFKGLKTFDADKASAETWVFAIAKNTVSHGQWELRRLQQKLQEYARQEHEAAQSRLVEAIGLRTANSSVDLTDLYSLLRQLPSKYRGAIVAQYIDKLSGQELADSLGVSDDTARQWVHRGLAKLRQIVDRLKPSPPAEQ